MTDKKEKDQWIKPQLVVIGRGQPEESVLAVCKAPSININGPGRPNCKKSSNEPCQDLVTS